MTVHRIGFTEPDDSELTIFGTPITFQYAGRDYAATVSRSNLKIERMVRQFGAVYHLTREHGRGWLADPCSMILVDSARNGRADLLAERKRLRDVARKLKGL